VANTSRDLSWRGAAHSDASAGNKVDPDSEPTRAHGGLELRPPPKRRREERSNNTVDATVDPSSGVQETEQLAVQVFWLVDRPRCAGLPIARTLRSAGEEQWLRRQSPVACASSPHLQRRDRGGFAPPSLGGKCEKGSRMRRNLSTQAARKALERLPAIDEPAQSCANRW
jgi:hypothetical protein